LKTNKMNMAIHYLTLSKVAKDLISKVGINSPKMNSFLATRLTKTS